MVINRQIITFRHRPQQNPVARSVRDFLLSTKDGYESVLNKALYEFETSATNRDLIIPLFSIMIPKAKIEYSKYK